MSSFNAHIPGISIAPNTSSSILHINLVPGFNQGVGVWVISMHTCCVCQAEVCRVPCWCAWLAYSGW